MASNPGLTTGQVPTAAQWNGYFSAKMDDVAPGAIGNVLTSNGTAWYSNPGIARVTAKFHAYGGQLRALHASLSNPFEQWTVIAMVGDSITWGEALPNNAPTDPRNHTMLDPRDNFVSGSYVNQLKRWIGATYFNNANPVLSNWQDSSSGQSTAQYSRTVNEYTNLPPFSAAVIVGSATSTETATPGTLLGYRHRLGVADTSSSAEISFTFTGNSLSVFYTSLVGTSANYVLTVDGNVIGTFATDMGNNSNKNSRTHNFTYVRNKTVKIKAVYPPGNTGVNYLDLEGLQFNKTCTIINQGIIGTDAREYNAYNFGLFGHSVATPDLNYAFIQLGTNDRSNTFPNYNQPNGVNNFARNLKTLMASLTAGSSPSMILMCANPVVNEDPSTYSFNMQDVRNTVLGVGSSTSTDVVDNYAIFEQMQLSAVLTDGLHPNLLGHTMIAQNVVNSVEQA